MPLSSPFSHFTLHTSLYIHQHHRNIHVQPPHSRIPQLPTPPMPSPPFKYSFIHLSSSHLSLLHSKMGNNMVKTRCNKKYAKVMNINGQISKIPTPSKVFDVIKDYPHHVLLDSNDFLRFNLRANPLDPDYQLRPKKLYLLVQLPKLDRVGSVVGETGIRDRVKMTRRSVSDVSGQTRVKMTLPKAVVDQIMAESSDDLEVAKRILRLHFEDYDAVSGGDVMAPVAEDGEERERREGVAVDGQCFKVTCSPYHRKYKRLSL